VSISARWIEQQWGIENNQGNGWPAGSDDDATPESTWAARRMQARRKVYAKPTVHIGPRDEEDLVEALCARNPYM